MAPLPIIADAFRVTLLWSAAGQRAVTVLHFLDSASTADVVLNHVDANVTANMWATTWGSASVQQILATELDGVSGTASQSVTGTKWSGQGSGEGMPAVATLVSHRTDFRGPRARGRSYIPFTSEGNVANGVVAGATVTTMQAAWTAFRTAMIAAGTQPIVASYVHSTQHPITAYTVEALLATQRRRQDRLR